MATYYYPQVTTGYRWNLLRRCYYAIGMEPINIGDESQGGVMKTFLTFSRDLTAAEKTILDGIMATDPQYPPSGGGRVAIVDLWEDFENFKTATGIPTLQLYYDESVRGSGFVNRIVLWNPTPFTQQQKKAMSDNFVTLYKG